MLDPLAEMGDPAPLAAVLADPDVEIVLHAGRQDVAILRRAWQTTFTNVFDTQIAAGFAGFSAQAGYTGLLHDVLRIRVAKSASFTRWDARPLTPEQLRYAEEDVEHLLPLADELQRRLRERGRLEWAREECVAIAEATDERDPEETWRRLPRVSGLGPRERAMARELAAWRERTAAAEDRPVGAWSATRRSSSWPSAARAARASSGRSAAHGPTSCAAAARTSSPRSSAAAPAEPITLEEGERLATDAVDGPMIALAESLVRTRAQEAGPGLRADRGARRPGADRRRRPPRAAGARRAHAARLAPRARRGRAAGAAGRAPPADGQRRPRAGRLTRTTSKSLPRSVPSARSWSLSQPGLGAPDTNQSDPLSATISPYSRIARATTRAWRGRPRDVDRRRSRSRSPIRERRVAGVGGEVPRRPRERTARLRHGHPQRVPDPAAALSAWRASSGRIGSPAASALVQPEGRSRGGAGSRSRRSRRASRRPRGAARTARRDGSASGPAGAHGDRRRRSPALDVHAAGDRVAHAVGLAGVVEAHGRAGRAPPDDVVGDPDRPALPESGAEVGLDRAADPDRADDRRGVAARPAAGRRADRSRTGRPGSRRWRPPRWRRGRAWLGVLPQGPSGLRASP